jgi:hypothetical protein
MDLFKLGKSMVNHYVANGKTNPESLASLNVVLLRYT